MPQKTIPLEYDRYYHIYNRGINSENLFREAANYEHFLQLYDKYIEPVAETYAWVLMPNHFHLLVRVKEKEDIGYYKLPDTDRNNLPDTDRSNDTVRSKSFDTVRSKKIVKPKPEKYFSHLFNAYTKYFNKRHRRHGSLFERPFKRKLIDNPVYFKEMVIYIHNNPVYHGFCEHAMEYPWSSYLSCISVKLTKLKRGKVIGWFDDKANFKYYHNKKQEIKKIEKYLFD